MAFDPSELSAEGVASRKSRLSERLWADALAAAALAGAAQVEISTPLTLPRWYEATAFDDESGAAFRIVTLPPNPVFTARRELGMPPAEIAGQIAESLGLSVYLEVSAEDLVDALLATRPDETVAYLGDRSAEDLRNWTVMQRTSKTAGLRGFAARVVSEDRGLVSFTERVATEPLIPVEGSPVRGVSLLSLIRKGENAAVIAYAGWTHNPLFLLAIPAGTIIMGGARGIAHGLDEGLYRWIVARFTGVDPGPEAPPADAEQLVDDSAEEDSGAQDG